MKKLVSLILIVIAFAFAASAQTPVRWRTSISMTSPTEGVITCKALISTGWHLYGLEMPQGGPRATTFDFSGCRGVSIEGKVTPSTAPIEQMDPLFGKTLTWWDRNVSFSVPFKVTDRDEAAVKIVIGYMCCNGGSCTRPQSESVTIPIPEYNPNQLSTKKK